MIERCHASIRAGNTAIRFSTGKFLVSASGEQNGAIVALLLHPEQHTLVNHKGGGDRLVERRWQAGLGNRREGGMQNSV